MNTALLSDIVGGTQMDEYDWEGIEGTGVEGIDSVCVTCKGLKRAETLLFKGSLCP